MSSLSVGWPATGEWYGREPAFGKRRRPRRMPKRSRRAENKVKDHVDWVCLATGVHRRPVGDLSRKAREVREAKAHVRGVFRAELQRGLTEKLGRPLGVIAHTLGLPLPNLHASGRELDEARQKGGRTAPPAAGVPQAFP